MRDRPAAWIPARSTRVDGPRVIREEKSPGDSSRNNSHATHVRGGRARWAPRQDDWRTKYGTAPIGDPNRRAVDEDLTCSICGRAVNPKTRGHVERERDRGHRPALVVRELAPRQEIALRSAMTRPGRDRR